MSDDIRKCEFCQTRQVRRPKDVRCKFCRRCLLLRRELSRGLPRGTSRAAHAATLQGETPTDLRRMGTAPYEPAATVERQLAQARAARLAEERRQGRRRYTIEGDDSYVRADGRLVVTRGGWIQRPGAGDFDGVNGIWSHDGESWA